MKKWLVYKTTPRGFFVSLRKLGVVYAKHQPDALKKAWAEWPTELDPKQTQAGFSVKLSPKQDGEPRK